MQRKQANRLNTNENIKIEMSELGDNIQFRVFVSACRLLLEPGPSSTNLHREWRAGHLATGPEVVRGCLRWQGLPKDIK